MGRIKSWIRVGFRAGLRDEYESHYSSDTDRTIGRMRVGLPVGYEPDSGSGICRITAQVLIGLRARLRAEYDSDYGAGKGGVRVELRLG
ncbi:hypothetical protein Trydic_g18431 [Trypoxylus dichotomus]